MEAALARALRELRVAAALSQTAVAQRVGVPQEAVSAWERARPIPIGHIPALEVALGVAPGMLLRRAGLCGPANGQSTRDAILADPALDEAVRPIVVATYDGARKASREARRTAEAKRRAL